MAKTILIIDDETDLMDSVRHRLEHEGFRTITAVNGVKGYRQALRDKPDLILLDIMMPAMDGFHTCRVLKRSPATRGIPVIMLTCLNDRRDVMESVAAGAQDYALKPIDFRTLMGKIVRRLAPPKGADASREFGSRYGTALARR